MYLNLPSTAGAERRRVLLLVDDRIGSKDLLQPLERQGVPCDLARLDFADAALIGRGPEDAQVYIGVELKRLPDLVASMMTGRFVGHQLPGLMATYDRTWLVVEGVYRAGDGGILEQWRPNGWQALSTGPKRFMASDLESWLLTQVIRGGVNLWRSASSRDTVRFLSCLYRWWTSKSFAEHRAHQTIYRPPPDRAMFTEPSIFVKMAASIPGVGWDRALTLEAATNGSFTRLGNLSATELQNLNGIGPKTAQSIRGVFDESRVD